MSLLIQITYWFPTLSMWPIDVSGFYHKLTSTMLQEVI